MASSSESLGGRIPLFKPETLSSAQRPVYQDMVSKMVPWANKSGFTAELGSGELVGPFNTILLSPEMGQAFLNLQESEQAHTSLSQRLRQVIILTVGAAWRSEYERYAHAAVSKKAGLSDKSIQDLASGIPAQDLSAEERLAQMFTWQLITEHHISEALFADASAVFGVKGIVDLIFLAGCYDTISALLNAFAVPVPS